MRSTIALLTDFGTQDHYVGVMKGVIAAIAPEANVIDISHALPPWSILAGQQLLRASVRYFPPDTVFLAIVDPGVGTSRRPLALSSSGHVFVGPDNGLFTPWLPGDQVVELTSADYRLAPVSSTFHGRDVFAPAAAHLALGTPLDQLGPPLVDPVRLEPPAPKNLPDGTIEGEVVYVDSFGNLITNVQAAAAGSAVVDGCAYPVCETYGSAASGELLALIGSGGQLEIAVREGSAAHRLGVGVGLRVVWKPSGA